jgi:hypothetical protein
MAGQSEKKRSAQATATIELYTKILIGLYAAYIPLRVLWCWSSFGWGAFFGLLVLSAVNYLALAGVRQALELGTPVTGAQDVLFVNWAVQALSILSDKAFYLYLVIPAYLLYQYGPLLKGYLMPAQPQQPASAQTTEADAKRIAKKERQAAMNERRRQG